MRCVAGVGLLALVGCNQIFGIAPTRAWDAGIDSELAMPRVRLTWQIAGVATTGEPAPVLQHEAIDPAPRLRIAPLAVALDSSVDQATYDRGDIAIPGAYLREMWRLEYTLEDGVPREVQWRPDDQVGHVAVPLFGRLQRAAWPVDGGYTVAPSNPPAGYTAPRVFTTGLWTEGVAQLSGPNIDYAYFNAISLSGDKGAPDPALGDRAFVVDYVVDRGCQVAVGSAALTSAALETGTRTARSVVWEQHQPDSDSPVAVLPVLTRLTDALGSRGSSGAYQGMLLFGVGASPLMPDFTSIPSFQLLSFGAALPVPTMLTLLRCPFMPLFGVTPPQLTRPAAFAAFPPLVHMQISHTRTIASLANVELTSGIETVAITSDLRSAPAFSAAIPIRFQLTSSTQQTFDLSGASDRVAIGPAGAFTFTFATEGPGPNAPADLRADHHDVVLHRIEGGALRAQRIYTVIAPRVQIDGPVLAPGVDYILEIRSYQGHPNAQRGDLATATYPYGSAIIFTRSFRTD